MIKISSLNAPISANKVSMFKLTIEELFRDYFRLIQAKSLALAMTKSVTFFLGHPVHTLGFGGHDGFGFEFESACTYSNGNMRFA